MIELIKELFLLVKVRKKYYLIPLLFAMFVLGILIVLAHGSAISPFIYSIF